MPVIYLSFLFSLFSSIILFYNLSISLSFCSICCLYLCCCTLLSIPLFFSIPLPLILSYHLSIYLTIYLSSIYRLCMWVSIYLFVCSKWIKGIWFDAVKCLVSFFFNLHVCRLICLAVKLSACFRFFPFIFFLFWTFCIVFVYLWVKLTQFFC